MQSSDEHTVRSRGRAGPGERREPLFFAAGAGRSPVRRGPNAARSTELTPDIAFLARRGVPRNILELAVGLAASRGTEPRQELFAIGFNRQRYWLALAEDLGLPFAADLDGATLVARAASATAEAVRLASSLLVAIDGRVVLIIAPQCDDIVLLGARLQMTPVLAERIRVAAPETIRAFLVARRHMALADHAVNRLARILPRLSARSLGGRRGMSGPVALLAAFLGLSLLAPLAALHAMAILASLFFLNCSVWKVSAALHRPRPLRLEALPGERLPNYSVLIPLYREAAIVPDLLHHLSLLDYPVLCSKSTKTADRFSARIDAWPNRMFSPP